MIKASIEWFAGFFDGEGSIMLSPSSRQHATFVARAAVGNTYKPSIDLFCTRWPRNQIRYIIGKTPTPFYTWGVNGDEAGKFLKEIQPYLIVKKEQARVLLEYLSLPWRSHGTTQGGVRILRTKEQKIQDLNFAIELGSLNRKGNKNAGAKLKDMKAQLLTVKDAKFVYDDRERLDNGRFA